MNRGFQILCLCQLCFFVVCLQLLTVFFGFISVLKSLCFYPTRSKAAYPPPRWVFGYLLIECGVKILNCGALGIEDIDFSLPENEVVVAAVDSSTGVPTSYAIRAYGDIVSGEKKQISD